MSLVCHIPGYVYIISEDAMGGWKSEESGGKPHEGHLKYALFSCTELQD